MNVFSSFQAGAQGVCKTLYAIAEDEKAERILLTKTRDLNHCQERIMKDMGLAYTEKCAKCQEVSSSHFCERQKYEMLHEIKTLCGSSSQDSKNLRGTTAYNYILKPAASGIVILEAAVNELIQFSPFTEMNGAAQMQTKYVKRYLECNRLLFEADGAADEPFSNYFQGNPWCSLRSRRPQLYQSKFNIFTVDL